VESEIQQLVRIYPEASSVHALAGALYRSQQKWQMHDDPSSR
jgi:hypothetical protein